MFTGIIEGLAEVKFVSKAKNKDPGASIRLRIHLGRLSRGMKTGSSISVNGACLTITKYGKHGANWSSL